MTGKKGKQMKVYFALIEKDKGSAFGISFPDLPGVFSASDDEVDIIKNAIEALSLWAEDNELPSPSGIEDIRKLDNVKQALKRGAFLLQVPMIENDTRTVRANVSFEAGTLRAIDKEAKRRGLTRAAFLASAAKKEILRARQ